MRRDHKESELHTPTRERIVPTKIDRRWNSFSATNISIEAKLAYGLTEHPNALPRRVKKLMRPLDGKTLTGLPAAHEFGLAPSIHQPDPPPSEKESHCLCLGGFFHRGNERCNLRGHVAAMPRQRGSTSTGTPLLWSDANVPNWRSNLDFVAAISPT